ncbi:hypothetical protein LOK49_LG01G01191 [Camellia lanceoleosa]|uniref:Uncharacterized protein n=1 Tax=Camellia lanceoleosa TaxID=1840588 RepID=A0ACC0J1M5_9ERIC|nr:hypothetical protein LOK49_LG01G01191 [Camellia lanceoleosa]
MEGKCIISLCWRPKSDEDQEASSFHLRMESYCKAYSPILLLLCVLTGRKMEQRMEREDDCDGHGGNRLTWRRRLRQWLGGRGAAVVVGRKGAELIQWQGGRGLQWWWGW